MGYRVTNAPTGRRANRRLMPFSWRLAIARVRPPYQDVTTKTASAGAIAPLTRQENGGLRAPLPLRATGGRELSVLCQGTGYRSALYKKVCAPVRIRTGKFIDCRIIPAKPIATDFKKK